MTFLSKVVPQSLIEEAGNLQVGQVVKKEEGKLRLVLKDGKYFIFWLFQGGLKQTVWSPASDRIY